MSYTLLLYHIIIGTKLHRPTISENHERDLYSYILSFSKNKNCHLYRIGGMPNHIHIFIGLPSTFAVADFVRMLKISTNNFMKEHLPDFPMFEGWRSEYFAATCSVRDKEAIIEYIKNQKQHHAKLSFKDELIIMLKHYGIEYNEAYL